MAQASSMTSTPHPDLEAPVTRLEHQLRALQQSLVIQDSAALEAAAAGLQKELAQAVQVFRTAASAGSLPRSMRDRLALAGAQVAAQRASLARATASLDRAIDVLMPAPSAGYDAQGQKHRASHRGHASA